MSNFDASRAKLGKPDMFKRFRVPARGVPLAGLGLQPETLLVVAERAGERRAFLLEQLAYHHAAQGVLAGKPYLVTL
jgi:hypothetical protein